MTQIFPVFTQCESCGEHVAFVRTRSENSYVIVDVRPINPDEATCILCGCTEERACPSGCSWVDDGGDPDLELCDQCLHYDEARHAAHRCAK